MRKSAMIPGNPWTLLITLDEDPDSLGCVVRVQQLTLDGTTSDFWEVRYSHIEEALREMEMAYGIGPNDWLDLG
jgi:hypothetical protein